MDRSGTPRNTARSLNRRQSRRRAAHPPPEAPVPPPAAATAPPPEAPVPAPAAAAAPPPEEPAKTHAEKQKVENAYFFRVDGKDKQGRSASFDYILLSNELTWVIGSTTEIASGGATIPNAEAAERVLTRQVRDFARERERSDRRRPRLLGRRTRS